jgi:hypothetical protein
VSSQIVLWLVSLFGSRLLRLVIHLISYSRNHNIQLEDMCRCGCFMGYFTDSRLTFTLELLEVCLHAPLSLDGTIQGVECTLPKTGHCAVEFLLDITFGFLRLQHGTMHNIGLLSGSTMSRRLDNRIATTVNKSTLVFSFFSIC